MRWCQLCSEARNKKVGAPGVGAPTPALGQRLWWTVVSTCGAETCGSMLLTQSWWATSADAGAARPRTDATTPLATIAANPNFFISRSLRWWLRCRVQLDGECIHFQLRPVGSN